MNLPDLPGGSPLLPRRRGVRGEEAISTSVHGEEVRDSSYNIIFKKRHKKPLSLALSASGEREAPAIIAGISKRHPKGP